MAEREMLKHAQPIKVLSSFGMQKEMPQNRTDTLVFRRALPIDAGSNGAPSVTASNYLLQEGITPSAQTITYQDVQVTLQEYGILLKLSSKAESTYEDNIPSDMVQLVGEHMGTLEELINFNVVRGGTNVEYAASSTASRANVNQVISLTKLRKIARTLESAHARKVTKKLASGPNFGNAAVAPAYLVFIHTDVEADVRNLPGFTPVIDYASGALVHEREIGAVENFRFITSPYFKPWTNAATSITASTYGLYTTGGTNPDVYPVLVVAEDAWGQVALKGLGAAKPIYLPAKQTNHANPLGRFGYVGAQFMKNAVRLNEAWMVRLEVGVTAL